MTTRRNPPSQLRVSVIAVHAAVAAISATLAAGAMAADPTVEELTKPVSTIEAGVIYTDKDSYKFGEYNGLEKKGAHLGLDLDLRGGGAYNQESGSTERWRVIGTDLGLRNRNLQADYARQGSWRIRFEYDELRRNQYDNYQTLWNGTGTSTLTLPATYPSAAARTSSSGLANWNNIQTPNLNATTTGGGPGYVIPQLMHGENIATTRKRIGLGGTVELMRDWTFSLNARTEKKEGTKLTGVAMGGFKGALVPEPIDSETTIVESQVRWHTKEATFGVGYNVSLYRNSIDAYTIEYPFAGSILGNRSMMNGAPDNQSHQFTLEGSYRFSPTLKFTAAGHYTRNTQNEDFHYQSGTGWNVNGGAPSSDSKEIEKNLLLRLTANPLAGLDVNAAYKLEDRDNRSAVGTYAIAQYDGTSTPSLSTTFTNTPVNRKVQTFTLDGRYNLGRDRFVNGGYEHQIVKRTADASINPSSHEINNPFASGEAKEDSLKLGYRQAITEAVAGQISYLHARRRAVDYEEPEVNPPGSGSNVGYYAEVPGFRQFFLNDRNRDKVRATLDFQASEAVFLQAGIDYMKDRYPGGEFGLKNTNSTAFNLDASVAANDKLSFNGFVSFEDMKSKQEQFQIPVARTGVAPAIVPHLADGSCLPYASSVSGVAALPSDYLTDPCRFWSATQADKIWTFGVGAKYNGLMGGKLTLSLDAMYSDAKTNIDFTGGTYYSNGTQNVYIPAANMPDIRSRLTELKLGAKYDVSKNSAVRLQLMHRRLSSSDPQFDLFGITSAQAFIGPGLASPVYRVNAVALTYVYNFR